MIERIHFRFFPPKSYWFCLTSSGIKYFWGRGHGYFLLLDGKLFLFFWHPSSLHWLSWFNCCFPRYPWPKLAKYKCSHLLEKCPDFYFSLFNHHLTSSTHRNSISFHILPSCLILTVMKSLISLKNIYMKLKTQSPHIIRECAVATQITVGLPYGGPVTIKALFMSSLI